MNGLLFEKICKVSQLIKTSRFIHMRRTNIEGKLDN